MMPPEGPIYPTWRIRKEHGFWVLRKHGQWHLTTSYWWLALWIATRDRRNIPTGHASALELARLAGY